MNYLRKIINKIGLDIHRYYKIPNRLNWIRDYQIETVFDIGANTGQFAKEIRTALPSAKIYSFEPLQDCFDLLKKTMSGDGNFEAFNYALGNQEGSIEINRSSYSQSSSLLPMAKSHKELFPHTRSTTKEIINIRTLDKVYGEVAVKPEILLKLDAQGYETEIISGGKNAFHKAKVVFIEASYIELYEGQALFGDIYRKMTDFGFNYRGALHQKINPKSGEVIFEDAIFIRT